MLPHINYPFVLVTHNSDFPSGKNKKILNNPYLIKWFGQNMIGSHKKTMGIPIGIQNTQWPGSDFSVLQKAIKNSKKELAYFYFSIKTNLDRKKIFNAILNNGFKPSSTKKLSWKQYIQKLSTYFFCFAPEGNGIDTHRLWECLYIGCIPIVKKNPILFQWFSDLPILWVDDFNQITIEFLKKKKEWFISQKWNIEKLSLSYWKKLITSTTTTFTTT